MLIKMNLLLILYTSTYFIDKVHTECTSSLKSKNSTITTNYSWRVMDLERLFSLCESALNFQITFQSYCVLTQKVSWKKYFMFCGKYFCIFNQRANNNSFNVEYYIFLYFLLILFLYTLFVCS